MQIMMARSIMDTVRAFYAGHGPKSCNKVYMKSQKEYLTEQEFEKKRTGLMVKMFSSSKAKTRNKNRETSLSIRGNSSQGKSYYELGRSIWQAGQSGTEISGNCAEMAWVSAYLAISEYHVEAKSVWIAGILPPGDHMFCLVGPSSKPTWKTPSDMDSFSGESSSAVVIDPWLHVACHAVNYTEFAARTLKKWHGDGKRVFWMGKSFDGKNSATARPGWYDPSQSYAKTFLTAPMVFFPAK